MAAVRLSDVTIRPSHQLSTRKWVATLVPPVVDRLDMLVSGGAKTALCEPMLSDDVNAPTPVKPLRPSRLASSPLRARTWHTDDTHSRTQPSSLLTSKRSLDSTITSATSTLPSGSSTFDSSTFGSSTFGSSPFSLPILARKPSSLQTTTCSLESTSTSITSNLNLPALKRTSIKSCSSDASVRSFSNPLEDRGARAVPTPAASTPAQGGLLAKLKAALQAKTASWLSGGGLSRGDDSRSSAPPKHCWNHMPWVKRGEKPCLVRCSPHSSHALPTPETPLSSLVTDRRLTSTGTRGPPTG
jgi:hypothetical protein